VESWPQHQPHTHHEGDKHRWCSRRAHTNDADRKQRDDQISKSGDAILTVGQRKDDTRQVPKQRIDTAWNYETLQTDCGGIRVCEVEHRIFAQLVAHKQCVQQKRPDQDPGHKHKDCTGSNPEIRGAPDRGTKIDYHPYQ